jgi:Family of unknown function (DUF6496)
VKRRRHDDPERLRQARVFMASYQRLLPRGEEGEDMAKSTAGIGPKGQAKAARVFKEYGKGELHSGSKSGPTVTSHDQAIAIALAQARKASRTKGSAK